VVLAANFDEDLESLLVVLQRSLVLTLAVVNITDAEVGFGHVRVVVATIDAGLDIERFRVHFQRLLVLALFLVDNGDVVVRRRHVRDARGHEVFGYENLCVRSRVHKILCTEKGRFEGYLVDIRFISSLFKNALNLPLKCDLIYYSSVCVDDQVLAP